MCIIALKPEKVSFTLAQLRIMWENNPDGAGFMYAEDGKVVIVKGLMTLEALWDAIQECGPLRKMVLHFRIRTHGAVSKELTHPFWITENTLGMVHNGVITALVNKTSEAESDTAVFARELSAAYQNPLVAIKHDFHKVMLESYIGFSKMVFMDATGATHILNESLGTWSKGVWYSNSRFQQDRPSRAPKNVEFPWEAGTHQTTNREAVQERLEKAFQHEPRSDRGQNKVTHVNRRGRESENARREQRPLLGCPSTQRLESKWMREKICKGE